MYYTLQQLEQYLQRVINLELQLYELNQLHATLCNRRNSVISKSEELIKSKPSTKRAGIGSYLSDMVVTALLAAGVGLFGGAIVIAVIYLWNVIILNLNINILIAIADIFTAEVPDIPILQILAIGTIIGAIVGALIGLVENVSYDSTRKARIKAVDEIDRKVDQCYLMERNLSNQIEICKNKYNETSNILNDYYNIGILYPKYWGLVPVSTIYEYLISGRCSSLTGHEGAYNLYELELRMNIIIGKLDEIIERLNDIDVHQKLLADTIRRGNSQIRSIANSIDNSLDRIENNTAISTFYNNITATNTSFLVWLKSWLHKN